MNSAARTLLGVLLLAMLGTACSPPAALREATGQKSEGDDFTSAVSPDEYPAPDAPGEPADARIGALVLTNESSWGLFLSRGEESTGSLVLEVLPDSPAQTIGLRPGDVITWLDGSEISNHEQLLTIFRKSKTNQHTLRVTRADGTTEQIETELEPSTGFSMLSYLETKLAAGADPITRYLLAENLPDRDRGIEMIKGLLSEHPDFAEGHALLARLLIDRVNRASGGGVADTSPDLLEATTAIDTAVELDSGSASLLRARSQIMLALGDPAKAEIDAERALELDENSAEAHFLLGTAQLTLSRPDEAIVNLHRAVELDPFVFDYYVNLALCYRALNREADAETTIFAARTLAGDDPELRQRLDELLIGTSGTEVE